MAAAEGVQATMAATKQVSTFDWCVSTTADSKIRVSLDAPIDWVDRRRY